MTWKELKDKISLMMDLFELILKRSDYGSINNTKYNGKER